MLLAPKWGTGGRKIIFLQPEHNARNLEVHFVQSDILTQTACLNLKLCGQVVGKLSFSEALVLPPPPLKFLVLRVDLIQYAPSKVVVK